MGALGAHEDEMEHAGQAKIAEEGALPRGQAMILLALEIDADPSRAVRPLSHDPSPSLPRACLAGRLNLVRYILPPVIFATAAG